MRNRSPRQDRWNRVAERKSGDATGRANKLASFLELPDAEFSCRKLGISTKKEKKSKKEKTEGLWKLTLRWKSSKSKDSHRSLKTASPTTLGFFTVPTGPTIIINSKLFRALKAKFLSKEGEAAYAD